MAYISNDFFSIWAFLFLLKTYRLFIISYFIVKARNPLSYLANLLSLKRVLEWCGLGSLEQNFGSFKCGLVVLPTELSCFIHG